MRGLVSLRPYQVFLNYPYDTSFTPIAEGLSFAVVAAGLIPVCGLDLTTPDRPRLEMLSEAISGCHYSAHDLSRDKGEGDRNFSRMNMAIELGVALCPTLVTKRADHRFCIFVASPHDYQSSASDLAGLDPQCHNDDPVTAVGLMYEWLRRVVPSEIFNDCPTVDVVTRFDEFRNTAFNVKGTGENGRASRAEAREVMYQICEKHGWWDWRKVRFGQTAFPKLPLAWRS